MNQFAETYAEARTRFLAAARERSARVESVRNPCGMGPAGEPLVTDVAALGPERPSRLLLCVSGTHGIEGYTGSAIQAGLLRAGFPWNPPAGLGFVLVHALNPYGFAYLRRVNEDNVDVNRNFVDHASPPGNPGYEEIHEALVPAGNTAEDRHRADGLLLDYAKRNGGRMLQTAVTYGQWTHPDGLFYGGTRPAWSHETLRDIALRYAGGVPEIAYIDLHTGLGRRGWGEPIFRGGRDPGALRRAQAWYGEHLTISDDGSSSSTPIVGNTASLIAGLLGDDQLLTAITLEFGTLEGREVLAALRADNWLHVHGAPEQEEKEIKRSMLGAFYPGDGPWRGDVWDRAIAVFSQAAGGLAQAA